MCTFFLALFEENIRKSLDQLYISRISGIWPGWISGLALPVIWLTNLVSGRIPDIKKAGLSGRISGWPAGYPVYPY
jgi:hypothetical protein